MERKGGKAGATVTGFLPQIQLFFLIFFSTGFIIVPLPDTLFEAGSSRDLNTDLCSDLFIKITSQDSVFV
ncbi:unnamed protein product [Lactuca virosa]|uniref:Uncharacterized protein n=1 Tax=Lactuca virosa TaxID=75947 RepID=A0AAU9MWP5_9ASTR|nr:unnamed protein product [Lactuca virosa]